jgi:hypothetical protein
VTRAVGVVVVVVTSSRDATTDALAPRLEKPLVAVAARSR